MSIVNMDFNPNKTPINLVNGSNLIDKRGILQKKNFFFSLYIKMGESTDLTYYQKKQRFNTK